MQVQPHRRVKAQRALGMEGRVADWYAKNTAKSLFEFTDLAKRLAAELGPDARLLEIAPGPGYLAIELAKLGPRAITGLDISHSFVRIAAEVAAKAGVSVDFRQGDVAAMPFGDGAFDAIVCRAAFKNFGDPDKALAEMHRVLAPGGKALVIDLRKDVSDQTIDAEVETLRMKGFDAFITRLIFKYDLRRRAYPRAALEAMIATSPFGRGQIHEVGVGYEIYLSR
jgi:ubiquinone/menaquinone biosynthesis C-methylase UbiE